MPTTALCTEEEIEYLVHTFYAQVRRDDILGPIFNAHVADWDDHLARLVDFWSSILLRTRRFTGTPMSKHAALPQLSAELFQRWLTLFHETTSTLSNQAMAQQAETMARRIGQSLWYGYQLNRDPEAQLTELPCV